MQIVQSDWLGYRSHKSHILVFNRVNDLESRPHILTQFFFPNLTPLSLGHYGKVLVWDLV